MIICIVLFSVYYNKFSTCPEGILDCDRPSPNKCYSHDQKRSFRFGGVDFVARNQGDLLGIYKFPEFDIYTYSAYRNYRKPEKTISANPFSTNAEALTFISGLCDIDTYSLVNNNPNKK